VKNQLATKNQKKMMYVKITSHQPPLPGIWTIIHLQCNDIISSVCNNDNNKNDIFFPFAIT
jgi:hypothetical protein